MGSNIDALTTIFTEFYYWVTVVFMFLIHVGFCLYEVAASRRRNHMHTLMKNTMVIPLVTVTFFFFGWWIYFAFPNGPFINGGINFDAATGARPWDPAMGTNLGDHINGVFWAAFLLFSWTAASIVSGSVIERIRSGAFWILAVVIGSFAWIIDASWGWHWDGWMVKILGYHDAYASGVIHAIAGGFALGVLIVLGPRLGKFRKDGSPREDRAAHFSQCLVHHAMLLDQVLRPESRMRDSAATCMCARAPCLRTLRTRRSPAEPLKCGLPALKIGQSTPALWNDKHLRQTTCGSDNPAINM